jgi:Icc-related predicted phosphoesterase
LEWLRQAVANRRPEGVLFAGAVLDSSREYKARITPWELTHDDAVFLVNFFETMGNLGVFTAVVPGSTDTPLEEFLRLGMNAEVEFPRLHLVHATLVEKGDVAVCGAGGRICEGRMIETDVCSRTLIEYHLRTFWAVKQPHKILLLATPPTGPLGGAEGSRLTSDLIDSYYPSLCVVAGPNECRGIQRIAHTLVVNPGHLAHGWAAWLDWNRSVEDQVKFFHLDGVESQAPVVAR